MTNFKESLIENIQEYYLGLSDLIPKLAIGIIVLVIFLLVSKFLIKLLRHAISMRVEDKLVQRFIIKTCRTILYGIALLFFLKIIGLGQIAVGLWSTAGIGAFILGFAFKDIGEHFIAGFILAFNRPFKVGDTVEIVGHSGTIIGLNLRDTHLKTFDGKDVYIPNGSVIKNPLINYTIDGFIRKEFVVGIDYGSDQDEVIDIMLSILNSHDQVLKEVKQPSVAISKIGNSSLELKAMYWLDTFDKNVNGTMVERALVRDTIKALEEKGVYRPNNILEIKNYKTHSGLTEVTI